MPIKEHNHIKIRTKQVQLPNNKKIDQNTSCKQIKKVDQFSIIKYFI